MTALLLVPQSHIAGNQTFGGNECSKILKNLELLKSCLVQYEITKSIIETLQAIKDFIVACCSKYLKASWKKHTECDKNMVLSS